MVFIVKTNLIECIIAARNLDGKDSIGGGSENGTDSIGFIYQNGKKPNVQRIPLVSTTCMERNGSRPKDREPSTQTQEYNSRGSRCS